MQNSITCSNQVTAGKTQSTTLKLPIYGCTVQFRIVKSVKKEVARLYKKYKINEEFEDEAEGAAVKGTAENYYVLLDPLYLSHNTIAHEIFHLANMITEDRGITDEETQAWMAGHLTGELYKFLEKKKLQVKHG